MAMNRRVGASTAVLVGLVVALSILAHCHVTTSDRSNWAKTTGVVGTTGEATKSSANVAVTYRDPQTSTDRTATMRLVQADTARALLARTTHEPETVYVFDNLVGTRSVCTEAQWGECREQAIPPWWAFLLLVTALVGAVIDLIASWKRARS